MRAIWCRAILVELELETVVSGASNSWARNKCLLLYDTEILRLLCSYSWLIQRQTLFIYLFCWQSKRLYWEGALDREQQGKGTLENCSAMWLIVSCFLVMGLAFWVVSGQSSCYCPCCRKESGAREDGHIPGLRWVPGTATKCGFLALHRKEFKSKS